MAHGKFLLQNNGYTCAKIFQLQIPNFNITRDKLKGTKKKKNTNSNAFFLSFNLFLTILKSSIPTEKLILLV